jgi:hypothetical protein
LKKLAANNIQGIEEVNMFKDTGEVIHFANPKVQASLGSNTFAISGHSDTKCTNIIINLSIKFICLCCSSTRYATDNNVPNGYDHREYFRK